MKKFILFLGLSSFTLGSQAQSWPAEVMEAYMNSCVEQAKESMGAEGATNYCSCTAKKLEERYPDANDLGTLKSEEITEIAKLCLAEGGTTVNTSTEATKTYKGATKWSQEVYDAYMNSCVGSAKDALGEPTAEEYCACTAKKLQKSYPDATKLSKVTQKEIEKVAEKCKKELKIK